MSLPPGTRLGSCEIQSPIGAGGMGEVYRARDSKLNRDVAIKVLPPLFAADPERLARFEREAQVLASLNHPNIAQIYGVEDTGNVRALVMELVPGKTLDELIQAQGLGPDTALSIARQLIDALEAAHEQNIVHRDLKPANIKVRDDGVVKVLDFGLAKALDQAQGSGSQAQDRTMTSPAMTQMGMIVGTAAYMSPEQARGRAVDRRADIWAFGLILFEMTSGRRAFEGDDVSTTIANVLKDDVPWSALPVDTPPRVRRVLRRCLEKDPRRRLSAIGDARLDLDEPDVAPDATATTAPARARTGWLPIAGALAAGMLIAAIGVSPWMRSAPAASIRRTAIIAPPTADLFPDGGESAISPDGTMVAFITGSPIAPTATQLWVRRLDAAAAKPIATDARSPFWSPDSKRIGFFGSGKLNTVSAEGGRIDALCDAIDGRGGTWSPRGIIVFAPSSGGALMRVPTGGGDASPALALDAARKETAQRFPFFLPDGTHYLFASLPGHNGVFDIFLGALDSPDRTKIVEAESTPVYVDPGYLAFSRKSQVVVQPFDAKALKLTGDPTTLDDTPGNVGTWFLSARSVSAAAGMLVYLNDPFGDTKLTWVDRTGRDTGVVETPAGRFSEVDISPDGRQVAVVKQTSAKDSTIWTIDLARHGATRIADAPHFNYYVAWSPDSTRLVFANDGAGVENLFVRDAMAATPIQPFYQSAEQFKKPVSWSSDGKFLLFSQRNPGTQEDLMVMPASGGGAPTPFVNDPPNELSGRFSPDGHWIAYTSEESGSTEVYVRSFPTPDKKYRVTTDGGTAVRWKRDGTALLMTGADSRRLEIADVRLGATLTVSAPRVVGSLPPGILAWDAAGDLEHLIVATPSGDARLSLTVVTDWMTALRKQ